MYSFGIHVIVWLQLLILFVLFSQVRGGQGRGEVTESEGRLQRHGCRGLIFFFFLLLLSNELTNQFYILCFLGKRKEAENLIVLELDSDFFC